MTLRLGNRASYSVDFVNSGLKLPISIQLSFQLLISESLLSVVCHPTTGISVCYSKGVVDNFSQNLEE